MLKRDTSIAHVCTPDEVRARQIDALDHEGMIDLPYGREIYDGTEVEFRVQVMSHDGDKVVAQIQDDSNLNGVLCSIKREIENRMDNDAAWDHFTFRVEMHPRD